MNQLLQMGANTVLSSPKGTIIVRYSYETSNSERRPKLRMGRSNTVEVLMDKGPINDYK